MSATIKTDPHPMPLTVKDYQRLEATPNTQAVERHTKNALDFLLEKFTKYNNYTTFTPNFSERRMRQLGRSLSSHPYLPKSVQVVAKVIAQEWILQSGFDLPYPMLQGQMKTLTFDQVIEGDSSKLITLESAIMPKNPSDVSWKDLIKHIMKAMSATAVLPEIDIENVEWPFDITYYKQETIENAVKELVAKGFNVAITPSYITVKAADEQKLIVVHQDLVVTIPKGFKIADDAKYQQYCSHTATYKSLFTLHNFLVERRSKLRNNLEQPECDSQNKEAAAPSLIPAMEEYLQKILDNLRYIATEDPLVRLYAFNIGRLSSENQMAIVDKLKELGYDASIGIHNAIYLTKNVLIRLPDRIV